MKAYGKDIWRAIRKGKKRFLSLMLITALGVTTMTGLRASCEDLRYSADAFFDKQGLFDVKVVSTLGLTMDDIDALSDVEGIAKADGIYSEKVHLKDGGQSVEMTVLSESGMNIPYILDGRLPSKPNEVAVIEKYSINTGKGVGDTIEIEESMQNQDEDAIGNENSSSFINKSFKISGVVIDVRDVNKSEGASAFRTPASSDYTFFITKDAVKADIFTAIYLKLEGTEELQTYSAEYENKVKAVTSVIESQIKEKREQARYDEIIGEANDKIADAQADINDEFTKAEKELANAWRDINKGKNQIASGEKELDENEALANARFASAWQEINYRYKEISDAQEKLKQSEKQLLAGEQELIKAEHELKTQEEETIKLLDSSENKVSTNKLQVQTECGKLSAQADSVKVMLGADWDRGKWQPFVEVAKKAYLPVISADIKISQLEEQLKALDSSSSEYQFMQAELEEAKAEKQNAQDAVSGLIAAAKNEFTTVLTPVLSGALANVDGQIAALDVTAPDYQGKLTALQQQKAQLEQLDTQLPQMAEGMGRLQATETVLTGQLSEIADKRSQAVKDFAAGYEQIDIKKAELAEAKKKLEESKSEIESGSLELAAGAERLRQEEQNARAQIKEGRQKLADSIHQLSYGETKLKEQESEYLDKKAEAGQELADAKKELEDIDTAKWYVQDRSSLGGYNNIDTDSSSIEALGTVFPVVFLIVAVLISLTTITRKVEEERGLIGTYKALGFTNDEIRRKYTVFALSASLLGGILGDLCGFVLLPKIVFSIFGIMYSLPDFLIKFDFFFGTIGILLFTVCIVGATVFACANELGQMPAVLMRQKAPKAGARVILERVPFIWNRLSFLNKVTARNLFRYKKRLFMTVMGIIGCTALLVCGFAIKDSVTELLPNQYERVHRYDLQAASDDKDNDVLIEGLDADENVEEFINLRMETVKIKNSSGKEDSLQIMVLPKDVFYNNFMYLENIDRKEVKLDNIGIYLTENTARILGINIGDKVILQDMELLEREVVVNDIVKNYLGNKVYMSQQAYEDTFGEYKANSVLINFIGSFADHEAYAERLGKKDGIVSSISMATIKRDFEKSFALVNVAVYIIISLAAGLAVVVLFTLSTTNISERERELATIKVLGFYDREVHSYVNKETFILTFLGILLGLPVGQYLGGLLTNVLKMPAVHFEVVIYPISYVYSIGIAFIFAVLVNLITNRTLNKIDPVEALKSVE